jgi:hypothetical protein
LVAELKESDEASEELGTVSSCDSLIQTPGPHAT